ncbi:MAG: tetratricopeptide repeat protein [Proteobacteria bacterium]|nr:tetratricopeptide repeat protein [Pseudomonadota bacterium]
MQVTVADALKRAEDAVRCGDVRTARAIYGQVLAALPDHVPALLGAGDAALADADFVAAEQSFRRAAGRDRNRASPAIGLAQALAGQHRFGDAWAALAAPLAADPPSRGALAAGAWIANRAHEWERAIRCCENGLARAPRDATLLALLGDAQLGAGNAAAARKAYESALAVDAARHDARVGLGVAFLQIGLPERAGREFETALAQGVKTAGLLANLGTSWLARGDYVRAEAMFARAVDADPRLVPALADLAHCRQYLCIWEELGVLEERLAASLDDPQADPRISPFIALALHFTSAQQLTVARRWSRAMLPASVAGAGATALRRDRLRIGYLSPDFRDHPTGRLMAGLFEAHDRSRVEVFGYSYGSAQDSPLRRRIAGAFDHWRDLGGSSDHAIAEAIRADALDVLIDRKGHTQGGRLAALAERPAPVQLHYMSFPATLGFDAIDGVIADDIVIPRGEEALYHERVFRLPRCYFVTDGAQLAPGPARRSDHGLPEQALVLASLNQSYKISPEVFAIWMHALTEVPGSVLWLFATHPAVMANLRAAAERRGIAAERIVFAQRVGHAEHLARIGCADLALDTLPYGSHTTGVDALWAGVPLLTCRGSTFAGRVGASLVTAAGLPELITDDLSGYAKRLIGLARDRSALRAMSESLVRGRATLPLWDTRSFAADFERLLERACSELAGAR